MLGQTVVVAEQISIMRPKKHNMPATNQEFVQKLFIVHWPPMKGVYVFSSSERKCA